jgi:hypothetical protein
VLFVVIDPGSEDPGAALVAGAELAAAVGVPRDFAQLTKEPSTTRTASDAKPAKEGRAAAISSKEYAVATALLPFEVQTAAAPHVACGS